MNLRSTLRVMGLPMPFIPSHLSIHFRFWKVKNRKFGDLYLRLVVSEKNHGEVIEETGIEGWEEQQQITICSKAGSPGDVP